MCTAGQIVRILVKRVPQQASVSTTEGSQQHREAPGTNQGSVQVDRSIDQTMRTESFSLHNVQTVAREDVTLAQTDE